LLCVLRITSKGALGQARHEAAENLATDDQAAADTAQAAEVGRVRAQAKLDPDSMQSRQLAIVGDPDMRAPNAHFAECSDHFGDSSELGMVRLGPVGAVS
jgi:hypothetical protein